MAISEAWWDEDYSWHGLAEKPWQGWVVPVDEVALGIVATVQSVFRFALLFLSGLAIRRRFQIT